MSNMLEAESMHERSFDARNTLTRWTMILALTTIGACGVPVDRGTAVAPAIPTPGQTRAEDATDLDEMQLVPPPTAGLSVPLEIVDGTILGVGVGTPLGEALRKLGAKPVVEHVGQAMPAADLGARFGACSTTAGDRWSVKSGGLTMIFDGSSPESARLTSWRYTGGPTAGFTELVAPHDVRIGDTRADIIAAFQQTFDVGDALDVTKPIHLRFGVNSDEITWFGTIDCAPLR